MTEGAVEKQEGDPVEGLVSKLRAFVREAVEETHAASAVAFEAIRETNPALAEKIFKEAVTDSARQLLRVYPGNDIEALFGDLESGVRQIPITTLYHAVDTIVASRLLSCFFEGQKELAERIYREPVRNSEGILTATGIQQVSGVAEDVVYVMAKLASIRERRVLLCLAATIAGPEAVKKAANTYGEYKREMLLGVVWDWLGPNVGNHKIRRQIVDYIAEHASDESIERFSERLVGRAYMGADAIKIIADEIFTGEEHIEF